MTRTWMAAACALLLLAGTAQAGGDRDGTGRTRRWSVGWEDGITLRRALDRWDVSVAAGPSDWLQDSDTYEWGPSLPDSLQGLNTGTDRNRRESGFVRLTLGRELTRWREFTMHGTVGGSYTWTREKDEYRDYRATVDRYDIRRYETDTDSWILSAGLRMAWRPVPFLGIQVRLGLQLRSENVTDTRADYNAYNLTWTRESNPRHTANFGSYGNYGTGSVEFFVWF